LRRTASYDVLSVKIRPTVSPVGERKNQEKKSSKHAEVLGCIFHVYWEKKNPERIEPKFCLIVDVRDVITWFKFGDDRLRGLGSAEGQSSPFPIDFDGRPYNALTLPCERVIPLQLCQVSRYISEFVIRNVQHNTSHRHQLSLGITLLYIKTRDTLDIKSWFCRSYV